MTLRLTFGVLPWTLEDAHLRWHVTCQSPSDKLSLWSRIFLYFVCAQMLGYLLQVSSTSAINRDACDFGAIIFVCGVLTGVRIVFSSTTTNVLCTFPVLRTPVFLFLFYPSRAFLSSSTRGSFLPSATFWTIAVVVVINRCLERAYLVHLVHVLFSSKSSEKRHSSV